MAAASDRALTQLLREVRACRLCEQHLPLGPRPILRASVSARILIVGQAPGTRVHETGVPWNDPSGARLREWMGVDRDTFYDETRIAIIPIGMCYPGRNSRSGDKPPRPECAPHWHPRLRPMLPNVRLTILAGQYAHRYYLEKKAKGSLTETVAAWREFIPEFVPLPHPSWRNTGWLNRNPWFEREILAYLRRRIRSLLK